jgi:hypothetical protein
MLRLLVGWEVVLDYRGRVVLFLVGLFAVARWRGRRRFRRIPA